MIRMTIHETPYKTNTESVIVAFRFVLNQGPWVRLRASYLQSYGSMATACLRTALLLGRLQFTVANRRHNGNGFRRKKGRFGGRKQNL